MSSKRSKLKIRIWPIASIVLTTLVAHPPTAQAQRAERLPEDLEDVGITEHLGDRIPLDAQFNDETGRVVRLAEYFQSERPVILNLVYYRCPMLCDFILNGMLEAIKEMKWTVGKEFQIVTVSFNPQETPTLAKLKKQSYLREYRRPEAAGGWHFLTGRQDQIRKLTEAVGFRYRYDEDSQQYAHQAAIMICTPDGRLSRYLYGVMFDPRTLRLSLVEATDGKIGSTLDQIILYCFHYDATEGRYSVTAMNLMRAGGILILLVLAGTLVPYWLREARRSKAAREEPRR